MQSGATWYTPRETTYERAMPTASDSLIGDESSSLRDGTGVAADVIGAGAGFGFGAGFACAVLTGAGRGAAGAAGGTACATAPGGTVPVTGAGAAPGGIVLGGTALGAGAAATGGAVLNAGGCPAGAMVSLLAGVIVPVSTGCCDATVVVVRAVVSVLSSGRREVKTHAATMSPMIAMGTIHHGVPPLRAGAGVAVVAAGGTTGCCG